MPRQNEQGHWISDDGMWKWDGKAWQPTSTSEAFETEPNDSASPSQSQPGATSHAEASSAEQLSPAFQTAYKGLTVSLQGEWWWDGHHWQELVKKPHEAKPAAKGPKLGSKESLAARIAVAELKKNIVGYGSIDAALKADYPMHPLGKKEGDQLKLALLPNEKVLCQCVGMSNQSLVVTDQKVLIIKTGFMAGSTFGAKATTFDYRTITSVEVRTGPVTGAFSIGAGGVLQRDRTYWGQKNDDAYKSPDAIPIAKVQTADFQRAAALIRELAGRAHSGGQAGLQPGPPDAIEQLKKLAELRDAGVLTPAEFDAKKAEILARI